MRRSVARKTRYVETKVKVTVAESRSDNECIDMFWSYIVYIKEGLENTFAPFAP